MPTAYCEPEDVRKALQESGLDDRREGPISRPILLAAIHGLSDWFRSASDRHFYDSTATDGDEVPSSPRTRENRRLSVPSSPHAQRDQLYTSQDGARYPVTTNGPYAKVRLPNHDVDEITRLAVRDRAGDVEDWVASNEYQKGRGEDYWLFTEGGTAKTSYLFIRAASIGPRYDYNGLLTVDYQYGTDAQDTEWQDVRRGIALLAASQVVIDDDLVTAIPDDGQLVNLETERDTYINDAVRSAHGLLARYL